jgi:glycosyltransferase involved in cell wall biosynthesis
MPEIFCSTIIPTIGRDTLQRAVHSALDQQLDLAFEVIVVNDSGRPLAAAGWQTDSRLRCIDTQRRERSVARNVGAGLAHGRYLHFLDDDDWLLPGAYATFAALAANHPAPWLYGAAQLTDTSRRCLYQFNHDLHGNSLLPVMAGEWVPLQASLIDRQAFFELGGFDPAVNGVEDKDLLLRSAQRFALDGTATPVAGILRGGWSSSTDWSQTRRHWHFACERVLNEPGTGARLRASVTSAYWHGRLLRLYLLSSAWNARAGRPLWTLDRLLHAASALFRAGPRLFSPVFWRALARQHLTAGFAPSRTAARPQPGPQPDGAAR